ncbi:EAL domain-containing protein [Salipaludibacillus sp. HK11]|uniref:EAL domain-containing protein n=1 Tax=Salipaludibacillus sp. HK11 TaxID=3394320 RepID=UPI0039FD6B99
MADKKIRTLSETETSIVFNHPYLILTFTENGEFISPDNENKLKTFLGYTSHQELNYKQLISNKSYMALSNAFKNALKGSTERLEITVSKKDKSTMNVLVTTLPIRNTSNFDDEVHIIIEDYTELLKLTQQLEVKQSHLTFAQEIADIGSWEYFIEKDSLYCSDQFYTIFGYNKFDDDSMEKPFEYIHPDDYERLRSDVNEAINRGTSYQSEFRIYHGNTNKLRYIKVEAESVLKENIPYKLVGIVKDDTEKKQLEDELTNANNNLRHITDNLSAGTWMKEFNSGKVKFLSKGLEEILQISLDKIYEEPAVWEGMIHPEDRNEVEKQQQLLVVGESIKHKYRIITGDGTTKWILDQTVPWLNEKGELKDLFGVIVDITAEVEMENRLNYIVSHDPLTSLPNQRSLYEKLDIICGSEENKFSILYLDLDRFNIINDSLGYQVGDEVLKHVAKQIVSIIPENTYVARLSSNDFIIIVQNYTTKENIVNLAGKIIKQIEQPFHIMQYDLHITTSIGISFFPEDGDNKLTLLENAHYALYQAKQQGKNNYKLYTFAGGISSYKQLVLEKDMRKAIINEEFEMYYQPQVDVHNGLLQSAEALIRWNHKDWGIVSPGEFIPLAEDNHLIHQMTDWVITKVCSQLRVWKINGYTIHPISINISPIRFFRKGLFDLVRKQLEINRIPAKYLEFEITERSLLKLEKNVLSTLAAIRELGVKVSIDDFGTGYASLNYLREFDADILKIDQVFIKNIESDNKKDAAIVSSILHLAKGLNMKIVAEGVEKIEQLEFLKQKDCDLIQGYLFSKPVPTKAFEQIMKTGYLIPIKENQKEVPKQEGRKFYRFEFLHCLQGKLEITEVNKKQVNLASSLILIKDISLGGMKLLSTLLLPINSPIKFMFYFTLLDVAFEIEGTLIWKNEVQDSTIYYGAKFDISKLDESKLADIINKMIDLRNLNEEIPGTAFIEEESNFYLRRASLE